MAVSERFFLYIGAQKAGSTSLYEILKQHPQIALANKKESKFFFKDELYAQGIEFYKRQYFDPASAHLPYLDIDPILLYDNNAADRIFRALGEQVKFIVTLREPVERAISHYKMEQYRGNETLDFETAINQESSRILTPKGNLYHAYINRGKYAEQLTRYFHFFPKENFKFFIFETDFLQNQPKMLSDICAFMNVPTNVPMIGKRRNATRKIRSENLSRYMEKDSFVKKTLQTVLPQKTRRKMRRRLQLLNSTSKVEELISEEFKKHLFQKYFAEDIQQLEELISQDLSHWKRN